MLLLWLMVNNHANFSSGKEWVASFLCLLLESGENVWKAGHTRPLSKMHDEKKNEQMQSLSSFRLFKFSCPVGGWNVCHYVCVLSFRPFCWRASQTRLREEENGEQHVSDPCATVDSMLRLLQTLAFCFWCVLLVRNQAVADEEALLGPMPSKESPPEDEQSSSWWPSFPSLPFHFPFYGTTDSKHKDAVLTTATEGLTASVHQLGDHSGSGESSENSEPPTTLTQGLLTSVTKLGPESLPTGTSDSPHSSRTHTNNDILVSDSYTPTSSSIRNTLFTNSPASTSTPEQHATHTHPPWGPTRAAGHSLGATPQHLEDKLGNEEEAEDFTEKIRSTIAPETTVPTALTWAAAQTTTTIPGPLETMLTSRHALGPVTTHKPSETTFVKQPQHTTVGISLHAEEAAVTETHLPQSESDRSVSEARSGPADEQPGVITVAMGIDHKLMPESITSTTPSQRVNFPITAGKQSWTSQ